MSGAESYLLKDVTKGEKLSTGTILSRTIQDSIGGPTNKKVGWYKAQVYWEQYAISGDTSNTLLRVTLSFYHKYNWSSTVWGNNNDSYGGYDYENNTIGGKCLTYIQIDDTKIYLKDSVVFDHSSYTSGGSVLCLTVEKKIPSSKTSVTLQGRCDIGKAYNADEQYHGQPWRYVRTSTSTPGAKITLKSVETAPTACPSISCTGKCENGVSVSVNWSAPTSKNADSYKIYFRYKYYDSGTIGGWRYLNKYTSTSCTHVISSLPEYVDYVQYRVIAYNGSLASPEKTSNVLYHHGVRIRDSGKWEWGVIKTYSSGTWVNSHIRIKTGGSYSGAK